MKRNTMMTEQELKKELETITKNLKPNPNNFIIINKWNNKYVFKPNRKKIYNLIEEYISQSPENIINSIERTFENFVDIKDIKI